MLTPDERKRINKGNKKRGSDSERAIAKYLGGRRVPLSGAIKKGPYDLTGDVQVMHLNGARELLKLEVKTTSSVSPKGERSFVLKRSVLDQAEREAEEAGSIGALWIRWSGGALQKDHVVMSAAHFAELVELARLGAELEK